MQCAYVLLLLLPYVLGDIYIHNPRGSNNRLNEKSNTRRNANRLFDSQNNDNGGYNVGDRYEDPAGGDPEAQYQMRYFQSSVQSRSSGQNGETHLTIEWTNQHGCGPNTETSPHKTNCNVVMQYMCMPDEEVIKARPVEGNIIRDGLNTQTQNYKPPETMDETFSQYKNRYRKSSWGKGLHEPMYWFDKCIVRERNHNLFSADQEFNDEVQFGGESYVSSAQTRQNPNLEQDDRFGYECPEERDYYPYWHPNPWRDIAVSTSDTTLCQYYRQNSFNVKPRHECVDGFYDSGERRQYSRWNNEADCNQNGGTWQLFHNYLEKSYPYASQHVGCFRDNRRNRIMGDPVFTNHNSLEYCDARCRTKGYAYFGVENGQDCWCSNDKSKFTETSEDCVKPCKADYGQICGGMWALNIYSVSTENTCLGQSGNGIDFMWRVPFGSYFNKEECLVPLPEPDCEEAEWTRVNHLGNSLSGVPNNYTWVLPHFPSGRSQSCVLRMRYNISSDDYDPWNTDASDNNVISNNPEVNIADNVDLQLNINTAQFGRTFQDRSHLFFLDPRPNQLQNERILNLNVRGKRGNIVQVFPAVEYDFIPNDLTVNSGSDLLHIQWTGSNSNPNNDGQGEDGTDRSNLVLTAHPTLNYPLAYENSFFKNPDNYDIVWSPYGETSTAEDLALSLATSGYYWCITGCDDSLQNKDPVDPDLNTAPASYPGVLLRLKKKGTFYYMCSRNNAFTNRSQKGRITVI